MAEVVPQLRRAIATDVEDVVALVESAYRGEASRAGWTTEADLIDGQRIDVRSVAATLADPTAVVLLLVVGDGGTVACCELRTVDGAAATFGMFAVSPMRQHGGFGDRLLAAAEQFAAHEWSATLLRLSVIHLRTELIEWYQRRGYEPTGEMQPFPYGDERFGRPRRDDLCFLVLEKRLRP